VTSDLMRELGSAGTEQPANLPAASPAPGLSVPNFGSVPTPAPQVAPAPSPAPDATPPSAIVDVRHQPATLGAANVPAQTSPGEPEKTSVTQSGTAPTGQPTGGDDLPKDAQLFAKLAKQVVDELAANDNDVLRTVFDQRYALGVKLKGATGDVPGAQTGSAWLFDGSDGPGWKTVATSREIKVAVRTAGIGGMTLIKTDEPEIATFVHYGRDNVMRVFEVDRDGHYQVSDIDRYSIHHALRVSPIDPCGEVHA
jgi:hypothetical protein